MPSAPMRTSAAAVEPSENLSVSGDSVSESTEYEYDRSRAEVWMVQNGCESNPPLNTVTSAERCISKGSARHEGLR